MQPSSIVISSSKPTLRGKTPGLHKVGGLTSPPQDATAASYFPSGWRPTGWLDRRPCRLASRSLEGHGTLRSVGCGGSQNCFQSTTSFWCIVRDFAEMRKAVTAAAWETEQTSYPSEEDQDSRKNRVEGIKDFLEGGQNEVSVANGAVASFGRLERKGHTSLANFSSRNRRKGGAKVQCVLSHIMT